MSDDEKQRELIFRRCGCMGLVVVQHIGTPNETDHCENCGQGIQTSVLVADVEPTVIIATQFNPENPKDRIGVEIPNVGVGGLCFDIVTGKPKKPLRMVREAEAA